MLITNEMPIELLGEVSIYFGIGIQVCMALLLGGMVGYDREKKLKSAGIKTNILICLGATLYTSIGLLIAVGAAGMADPNRVAAQIVSGIGFLGAGAIIQSQGAVVGMTTAATIWVVAAIGFTIGAGYPFTAAIFTVTTLVVLKMITPIYKYLEAEKDFEYYQLEILSKGSIKKTARAIMEVEGFTVDELIEEPFVGGKKGSKILSAFMRAHPRHMERLVYDLKQALKVQDVAYYPAIKAIDQEEKKGIQEMKKEKSREKESSKKS